MLWDPLRSLSKCLLLLDDDSILALHGHPSCLGIGHSEHVISSYSSVNTAVPWDGLSKLLGFWLDILDTVESFLSLLKRLIGSLSSFSFEGLEVIRLCSDCVNFFLKSFIWNGGAIKSMHLRWWDWLIIYELQVLKLTFLYMSSPLFTPTNWAVVSWR